ncbi:MAG TPA: hypothetical protein VF475_06560 [Sphingobium sp.]
MKSLWAFLAPAADFLVRRGIAKRRKEIRKIGRRTASLQLGFAMHMFETVPALKEIVDDGSGYMKSLTAVEKARETVPYWNYKNIGILFEVIDEFTDAANRLLDNLDKGNPRTKKMFNDQKTMRGWFDAPYY